MVKQSAGILLYKKVNGEFFVLLAHPGGPFWAKKDLGSWSIPKGEFTDETPLDAAIREFKEETGVDLQGDFIGLEPVRIKSGKTIFAFLHESDFDVNKLVSNTFEMEWPPKSGMMKSYPEIDKAGWFSIDEAMEKINQGQIGFIAQLTKILTKK